MKRPWFKFWVADWLIDTASMTLEEGGAYIKLLAHQWAKGAIPSDPERLSRMIGVTLEDFEESFHPMVAAKFPVGPDGQRRNERLEREREESDALFHANSINGSKGGHVTASGRLNFAAAKEQRPGQRNPSLSEGRSQKTETERDPEKAIEPPPESRPTFDLDAIYAKYPRKKGRAEGLKKLKTLVKTQEDYEAVIAGVQRTVDEARRKGTEPEFIPHFSTWVNAQRWLDEPDQLALPASVRRGNAEPMEHVAESRDATEEYT